MRFPNVRLGITCLFQLSVKQVFYVFRGILNASYPPYQLPGDWDDLWFLDYDHRALHGSSVGVFDDDILLSSRVVFVIAAINLG